MQPTSEQELKQLLEEGKITEEEYKELLEALRQKETTQEPIEKLNENKSRSGYGKAALVLLTIGIALQIPGVLTFFDATATSARFFLLAGVGVMCEFLAFIFGILGWKSKYGKIVVIGLPCLYFGVPFLFGFFHAFLFSGHFEIPKPEKGNLISHKAYPLDSLEGLISQNMAEIDEEFYVNGEASLKFVSDSSEKKTIRLYEVKPTDVESGILIYQAQLKSTDLNGQAYLEMWCNIPGRGEFFSRGFEQSITGTTDWIHVQTPFRLELGQKPDNVKLNLVIEGIGTVWIDDIVLSSNPLK